MRSAEGVFPPCNSVERRTIVTDSYTEFIHRVFTAERVEDLYQVTVDTAITDLGADACVIATGESEHLTRHAAAGTSGAPDDVSRLLSHARQLRSQWLSTENSSVIDDLTDIRGAASTDSSGWPLAPYQALLSVPIEDQGLFLAVSSTPAAFSEADRQTIDQLIEALVSARTRLRSHEQQHTGGETDRLEEIARIVSHDIVSPLNVVRGSIGFARHTDDVTHLERATTAIDRVEALLDGVVTRARTGRHIEQRSPVALELAAETAWDAVRTRDATLEIKRSQAILADENRLCQLLENLFRNASAHAGDEVAVRVGTLTTEPGFYVEDTGPGIPADQRDQIFEWGYSSETDHQGYGLSIVRRLTEAHGWDVAATDGSDGGARFEITGVTPGESAV